MKVRNLTFLAVTGIVLGACERAPTEPMAADDLMPSLNLVDGVVFGQPQIAAMQTGAPCGLPGSDADGNLIFGGIGEVNNTAENRNHVILTCKGDDIINESGRGQQFSGFACGISVPSTGQVVLTNDSRATVSASGQGSLWCRHSF